jgi:hypothetical protein
MVYNLFQTHQLELIIAVQWHKNLKAAANFNTHFSSPIEEGCK